MKKTVNTGEARFVLTGATGGIGSAIAHELDRKGYRLLLAGRLQRGLDELLTELSGTGHATVAADLASEEGVEQLKLSAREFGANGLINSFGTNRLATLDHMRNHEVAAMINVNLVAPIQICSALLPVFLQCERATIVNIGSVLGSIGYAGSSIYCASKFGLRGFTESLRRELADSHIRVLYFGPRATATAMNTGAVSQMNNELGIAMDEPAEVARQLAAMLESSNATEQYVGFPESFFIKINKLFPGVVDRALKKQLPTIKQYCSID